MLLKLHGSGANYVILYDKNSSCIWKTSSESNVESERVRACCSKLGYFINFLRFLFDYVVCYLLLTCLLSVYFSKTVLVGLNLCCFQMLFFPPTQEKEDHSLTKHLYYSQLFLWIFLLNSLLKVTNFYMLPSLVCFSIVVFYCNKILVVIVQ